MMTEYPQGVLTASDRNNSIGQNVGVREAGLISAQHNTLENLKLMRTGPDVIKSWDLSDGITFTFNSPTGPYTPRAVMLIAHPHKKYYPRLLHELPKALTIYDFPKDGQFEYWSTMVAGLKSMRDLMKNEPGVKILCVENSVSEMTSVNARTSRTIALPHIHFLQIDPAQVKPNNGEVNMQHLKDEQAVLSRKNLVEGFIGRLRSRLSAQHNGLPIPDFKHRVEPPFGYSFLLPADDIGLLTQTLELHNLAYKETVEKYVNTINFLPSFHLKDKLKIPQHSFRLYTSLDGDQLRVIISPEFVSYAGVMEALGIRLDRRHDIKNPYSDQELKEFYTRFVDLVQKNKNKENEVYLPIRHPVRLTEDALI